MDKEQMRKIGREHGYQYGGFDHDRDRYFWQKDVSQGPNTKFRVVEASQGDVDSGAVHDMLEMGITNPA